MALRKNKTELLDRIITKAELIDYDYYWSYWYDDEWNNHDGYCNCYMCIPIDYEYLPDEIQPKSIDYVSKRISPGILIDMNSIYSKEVLRQKRINHILGIESMEHSRPTLGDILNIKK